jgi:predicted metalloprotease
VPSSTSLGPGGSAPQDELADFVSVVLADTEDTWRAILPSAGVAYDEPVLVLFSGYTQTACGLGQSATGPFYCPLDRKLYIDLGFYDELRTRFGAPGDFAQAYVIAHEVGHHVQTLLGISQEVDAARRRSSQVRANELSVRLELQADCLSGIWAHHAQRERQILEEGDIEEGLAAAAAIGDDRIQRQTQGHVVPDSFTHGSSQQRVRWFRLGFETGDLGACDTFSATDL